MSTPASAQSVAPVITREQLFAEIDKHREQIAAALPPGTDPDRFFALGRQAIAENPRLLECSTGSVMRALAQAAASGLPLDGRFSSLIVRNSKPGHRPTCHWDASYRGWTSMALASGALLDITGHVVREHDEFTYELGTEPKLVHRPKVGKFGGEVVCSYAVARLRGGGQMIEILLRDDLERIRAMSPAGAKGPWSAWADEMAKKSALRRLLKRLPAAPVRWSEAGILPAALPAPSIAVPKAVPVMLPEEENALECRAIETLSNAGSEAELGAAWAAIVAGYQQRGAAVPLKIEAARNDYRRLAEL